MLDQLTRIQENDIRPETANRLDAVDLDSPDIDSVLDDTLKSQAIKSIEADQPSRGWRQKLILSLVGQSGALFLSLAAVWAAFAITGASSVIMLEAIIAIVLLRTGMSVSTGPQPLLADFSVRRKYGKLLIDEFKIVLLFLAACFLFAWPIERFTAGLFCALNIAAQMGLCSLGRVILAKVFSADHSTRTASASRRVLIVGSGKRAQSVADMIIGGPEFDTVVVGFLDYKRKGMWRYRDVPLIGSPDDLHSIVGGGQVDAVFVAVEPGELARTQALFATAEQMGVPVCLMPHMYTLSIARAKTVPLNGRSCLVFRRVPESRLAGFVKTLIDRVGATVGLALISPLMLLTALAVKIDSRGPVFFKQIRSGLNGRPFFVYKFRTMCNDAEKLKKSLESQNEMSGPVFKIKRDPRITSLGHLLRKFSIDELPQFINVLRGEMSLVGPRPPLPKEVAGFEAWQRRKLSVKPGLTCLWQVNGRNQVDFEDWMKLDLIYIDNWSLWLDTKILAKTVPAVLKGSGV
ncbi:MAG: sugar transferase [candidate division Zixibacteria bacterium]